MLADLRELYQEVIIDHSRSPRNFREMASAERKIEGFNPLCGDRLTLYLKLDKNVITDASFIGSGCAISTASASLMTEMLRGKTLSEGDALFQHFHNLLTESDASDENLGKLTVLAGVREFPSRVKCATLVWHALHAAIINSKECVSTEV